MKGVIIWDLRSGPNPEKVGTIKIKGDRLIIDGPAWLSNLLKPAGKVGLRGKEGLVDPEPSQRFLEALVEQYNGSGISAEPIN